MSEIDDFGDDFMPVDNHPIGARHRYAPIPKLKKFEIARRLRAGETHDLIARAVGVSRKTVLNTANALGLRRKPSARPAESIAEAKRLRASGVAVSDIAKRFGVNMTSIYRWTVKP